MIHVHIYKGEAKTGYKSDIAYLAAAALGQQLSIPQDDCHATWKHTIFSSFWFSKLHVQVPARIYTGLGLSSIVSVDVVVTGKLDTCSHTN